MYFERKNLKSGRYRILSVIAQGGFGITYKAVDNSNGKVVCIKEFFIDSICEVDSDGRVRPLNKDSLLIFNKYKTCFIKEAQTLKSSDCRGIVKFFDIFEENGTAYYVMEYVDGAPLSDIIPPGGLDTDTSLAIIRQILSAVKYIHERKITHLDIKPSNILVRKNGEVVLIDFGGSKRYTDDEKATSTSWQPTSGGFSPLELYMVDSQDVFSPSADIYGIGATLYNMVTGEVPPSAGAIFSDGNPIAGKDIPDVIKNVILKSMAPRRSDRYKSVDEMESALDIEDTDNDSTDFADAETTYVEELEYDSEHRKVPRKVKRLLFILIPIGVLIIILGLLLLIKKVKSESNHAEQNPIEFSDDWQTTDSTTLIRELERFVNEENSKPLRSYQLYEVDSLALTEKGLECFFTIYPEYQSVFYEMTKSDDFLKNSLITGLKKDKTYLELGRKLSVVGRSLIYHIRLGGTKKSRSCEITSLELDTIKGYEGSTEEMTMEQLEDIVRITSDLCPQEIDDGLVLTDCKLRAKNIVYTYKCSKEYYSYIQNNIHGRESDLKREIESDPVIKIMVDYCAKHGLDLVFRYTYKQNSKAIQITYNTNTKTFY